MGSPNISGLIVGKEYTRPQLARMWGYADWHGFGRGVFTPKGADLIVLFVTEQKQSALPQYRDYFRGDDLHWEGELHNQNDERIVQAQVNGDCIVLFYRKNHRSPFTYYGPISLRSRTRLSNKPSKFVFATNGSA